MAQAYAFAGSFNEAGNVGHDEAAVVAQVDDAENGVKRRKVIGRYFRLSRRYLAQDTRLADAGIA